MLHVPKDPRRPDGNPDWPEWFIVYPEDSTPYLVAVYDDGTEVGPYPVVLPRP